jgi:hypothetical protein
MAPSKAGFKAGDGIERKKKPHERCVIKRSIPKPPGSARNSSWWDIEFEHDGHIEQLSSQMLRWPKVATPCPAAAATAATSRPSHTPAANLVPPKEKKQEDSDKEDEEEHDSVSDVEDLDSDDEAFPNGDFDSEDEAFPSNEDESIDSDTEYDAPCENTDLEDAEAEDEEDFDPDADIPVEPEDIHKTKWDNYKEEKAKLIRDTWTVTVTANSQGICLGATVETKRQPHRQGEVVGQTAIQYQTRAGETKQGTDWLVNFDGTVEQMRPQTLKLVHQNDTSYVWTAVEDSEPAEGTAAAEYQDGVGLSYFDFNEAFNAPKADEGKGYGYPYLKLLQKMWPGYWKQQLRQLNLKIAAKNASDLNKKKKIHQVSEHEWWRFIGILLSAAPHGKGGINLWEKHSDGFSMSKSVDYGPAGYDIMAEYRFKEIKACFPWAFQDVTKADEGDEGTYDPWNMILLLVEGFNSNRHAWVAASVRKVLDESMSAWCPQTTPTGGLPNISFILRKPEPLGTEFKCIACTVTGKRQSTMVASSSFALIVA